MINTGNTNTCPYLFFAMHTKCKYLAKTNNNTRVMFVSSSVNTQYTRILDSRYSKTQMIHDTHTHALGGLAG